MKTAATLSAAMRDAFIANGFTREEAISFVAGFLAATWRHAWDRSDQ